MDSVSAGAEEMDERHQAGDKMRESKAGVMCAESCGQSVDSACSSEVPGGVEADVDATFAAASSCDARSDVASANVMYSMRPL